MRRIQNQIRFDGASDLVRSETESKITQPSNMIKLSMSWFAAISFIMQIHDIKH